MLFTRSFFHLGCPSRPRKPFLQGWSIEKMPINVYQIQFWANDDHWANWSTIILLLIVNQWFKRWTTPKCCTGNKGTLSMQTGTSTGVN